MNRTEQSILAAYKNGTLGEIAAEKARRNESGFTFGWTTEQHLERITKKALELVAAEENAAKEAAGNKYTNRQPRTYNTGMGYWGTKKDAARGFDGIE
jgi:glycogen synthase